MRQRNSPKLRMCESYPGPWNRRAFLRAAATTAAGVFDVVDGGKLENSRLFCDMGKGGSDGIRCDVDGNVWAAAGWGGEGYDGVHIFAPDGKLIGHIQLPETCANLCFGGAKRNRLFMAASQSLYALYVNTQGAQIP